MFVCFFVLLALFSMYLSFSFQLGLSWPTSSFSYSSVYTTLSGTSLLKALLLQYKQVLLQAFHLVMILRVIFAFVLCCNPSFQGPKSCFMSWFWWHLLSKKRHMGDAFFWVRVYLKMSFFPNLTLDLQCRIQAVIFPRRHCSIVFLASKFIFVKSNTIFNPISLYVTCLSRHL